MVTFAYIIKDELGLHARPTGILVKEARTYQSKIQLSCNGKTVDATHLLAVMAMGVKCGNELVITVEGPDEEETAAKFEAFLKETV